MSKKTFSAKIEDEVVIRVEKGYEQYRQNAISNGQGKPAIGDFLEKVLSQKNIDKVNATK